MSDTPLTDAKQNELYASGVDCHEFRQAFTFAKDLERQLTLAVTKNREFEAQGAEMRGEIQSTIDFWGNCNCGTCRCCNLKSVLRANTLGTKLVEEMERLKIELSEAQQWIDSEPDWKDKMIKIHLDLTKELAITQQKFAAAMGAVKANYEWHKKYDEFDGCCESELGAMNAAVLKDADASGWVSVNGELVKAMEQYILEVKKAYEFERDLKEMGSVNSTEIFEAEKVLSLLATARSTSTQGTK